MYNHIELGNTAFYRMRKLKMLIREGKVVLGGNRQLKIYGTLSCKAGKRMKTGNRVFFSSEQEAIACGYRACGNCMRNKYRQQHEFVGTGRGLFFKINRMQEYNIRHLL